MQMVGTGSAPPVPGVSRPPDPVVLLSGSPSPVVTLPPVSRSLTKSTGYVMVISIGLLTRMY